MLELANNPASGTVKYRWLAIVLMGLGILFTINAFVGLGDENQAVKQLVGSGTAGGFLIGIGFYISAIYSGRKFLSPLLDKETIKNEISKLEKNT